jgi:hypothetical protein
MIKYLLLLLISTISYAQDIDSRSIVEVKNATGKGSGFVIYSNNNISLIATNLHVCSYNYKEVVESKQHLDFKYGNITVISNNTDYKADVLTVSIYNDLCFLEVYTSIPSLNLSKSFKMTYNEQDYIKSPSTYISGLITFIRKDNVSDQWSTWHRNSYVIKGNFEWGQSGSAVVNSSNEVIGVFWGRENFDYTLGYMIDSDTINYYLNKTKEYLNINIIKPVEL